MNETNSILEGCSKGFILALNLMKDLNRYVYIGHDEVARMQIAAPMLKAIFEKMAESDEFIEKVEYVYQLIQERYGSLGFIRFLKFQETVYRTSDSVELVERTYNLQKHLSRS